MSRLYFAHLEGSGDEPFRIELESAPKLNELGYGIFWSVNEFDGLRRLEHLTKVRAWFVEIDGDKEEAARRLKASPLLPSLVVESRNGYHVYFDSRGEVSMANYKLIQEALLKFFSGDKNAKDAARMLRVPGYKNWKDKEKPFVVTIVHQARVSYTELAMLHYFPREPLEARKASPAREKKGPPSMGSDGDSLSSKLDSLNNREALEAFSGHSAVRGEVFTFKPASRGHLNIYANGKITPCFIDEHGRIGRGGPTIWQWLKWYGHSDDEIARLLREVMGL